MSGAGRLYNTLENILSEVPLLPAKRRTSMKHFDCSLRLSGYQTQHVTATRIRASQILEKKNKFYTVYRRQ